MGATGTSDSTRTESSQAILDAALRLIAKQGEHFTTQDLIKEAGVALQTFYRQFGGKDRLLVSVIGELIKGHCQRLERQGRSIGDPAERLRVYISSTIDGLAAARQPGARFITSQHWRLLQKLPTEMAEATRPFTDLLTDLLRDGKKDGALAPRDIERDAWLIGNLVMAVFHHAAFAPDDPLATAAAEELADFCLSAVRASP